MDDALDVYNRILESMGKADSRRVLELNRELRALFQQSGQRASMKYGEWLTNIYQHRHKNAVQEAKFRQARWRDAELALEKVQSGGALTGKSLIVGSAIVASVASIGALAWYSSWRHKIRADREMHSPETKDISH